MELPNLEESFLLCRTFGHAWRIVSTAPDSAGYYRLVLRCRSCKTERWDFVSPNSGHLASRRYEYPDGYRSTEKGDTNPREEFRIELIRRRT